MTDTDESQPIIPYQELLGNYDAMDIFGKSATIIPYQELLGNYDKISDLLITTQLYHTKSY